MTVNSRVIKTFLSWSPDAVDVPLMNGLRIQILPTIEDLPRARKHQFAAFIASEALLVVWDDDAMHLVDRAKLIESELMELVWKTGEPEEMEDSQAKKEAAVSTIEIDEESGEVVPEKRATHLLNTILVSFTLVIIVVMLGAGMREIAIETSVDHNVIRLAFVALTPVQIFFTLVSPSALSLIPFGLWSLMEMIVLCPSHRRLHCPMHRSSPPDAAELEILLCHQVTSSYEPHSSACYNPVSGIQGRSCISHRTHRQIHQASYLDLRATGRFCQYVHK